MRRLLALTMAVAVVILCGSALCRPAPVATETPDGMELWESLPPELLSNVIESKMEEMSSYQDRIRRLEAEIVRVQEIQACKMASPRPPPDK